MKIKNRWTGLSGAGHTNLLRMLKPQKEDCGLVATTNFRASKNLWGPWTHIHLHEDHSAIAKVPLISKASKSCHESWCQWPGCSPFLRARNNTTDPIIPGTIDSQKSHSYQTRTSWVSQMLGAPPDHRTYSQSSWGLRLGVTGLQGGILRLPWIPQIPRTHLHPSLYTALDKAVKT